MNSVFTKRKFISQDLLNTSEVCAKSPMKPRTFKSVRQSIDKQSDVHCVGKLPHSPMAQVPKLKEGQQWLLEEPTVKLTLYACKHVYAHVHVRTHILFIELEIHTENMQVLSVWLDAFSVNPFINNHSYPEHYQCLKTPSYSPITPCPSPRITTTVTSNTLR